MSQYHYFYLYPLKHITDCIYLYSKLSFARLDDVNERKLQKLRQWDKNHYDAVMWLRANKGKFKMEVFEPPIVSLNVSNRHFVDSIEACFSGNQMKVGFTRYMIIWWSTSDIFFLDLRDAMPGGLQHLQSLCQR